jgi:pilus assembly protein CpaB
MNPRRLALIAALAGLATTVLVYIQVQRVMAPAPAAPATVSVVMAALPVNVNDRIQPNGVVVRQLPPELVPAGAFSDPSKVVGRIARFPILAGEAIRADRLIAENMRAGLSAQIPSGKRAFTVQVNEVTGIAGLIQPGDKVDVLSTLQDPALDTATAITVLQNVPVLAIAQDSIVDPQKKPKVVTTVTLAVSPAEAERLALAAENGALRLSLRGQHQDEKAPVGGVRLDQVIQAGRPARAAEVAEAVREEAAQPTVTVIRGSSLSRVAVSPWP